MLMAAYILVRKEDLLRSSWVKFWLIVKQFSNNSQMVVFYHSNVVIK